MRRKASLTKVNLLTRRIDMNDINGIEIRAGQTIKILSRRRSIANEDGMCIECINENDNRCCVGAAIEVHCLRSDFVCAKSRVVGNYCRHYPTDVEVVRE